MTAVTKNEWVRLVRAYEQADQRASVAFDALEALPPLMAGGTEEEWAYDKARDLAYAHEAGLLAVTPPSLSAAAYQLKLFAVRHHAIDIEEPMPGEEQREEFVLRRIHDLLVATEASR